MREGWEIKKLGDITISINGLWIGKKPPYVNIAVIRNTNFSKDCKLDTTDIAYIDVEEKQFATRKLQYGDIIIEKSGGSDKQPVGRPILFNIKDGDYSFSNFTTTLRVADPSQIIPSFLHKVLYAVYRRGGTEQLQAKTTGLRNLDFNAYKKLNIPVPTLSEQQKIVEELDCLSNMIDLKKKQLETYDKLAQSIFYDMFGDPIANEKGWDVKQLDELCDISSSKRIFANEYTNGGIPFYRGKEITEKSKGLDISVELYISYERYNEIKDNYGVPQIGDILLTAVGTIGNMWVVNSQEPFYFKDGNILWLHMKTQNNSVFFKELLGILIAKYKAQMANGCAYNALTIVNLKKMPTSVPPIEFQQQFAEKIDAIEKQKDLIKQTIKSLEELFNSRMDYYFN